MANSKRILLPIVILGITIAVFMGLMITKKSPPRKPEKEHVPFVSVEPITLASITVTIPSQGLVKPRYETRLLAQVSGEIMNVSDTFVQGGLVTEGELLAQIDPFDYEVRLQQAKAELASARATFIQERAQGRVAEAEWKNITSAEPSELGLRKPQQERALAAVQAAEASLRQAQKELERTRIKAPYDALIAARNISPGTYVNVGASLGTVLNTTLAEIRLPIPGSELQYLNNKGLGAPVVLNATLGGDSIEWQAHIIRDEGVIDEQSRMIYLVAQLDDPYNLNNQHAYRLPFGTYVTASIAGRELPHAARVPRHLLSDNRIALYKEHRLAFADVTVLRHENSFSLISGLKEGDLLITSSLQAPVEGMKLETGTGETASTSDAALTASANPDQGGQ